MVSDRQRSKLRFRFISFLTFLLLRFFTFQFSWRPRPKTLLTEKDHKEVSKNIRKLTYKFEKKDELKRKRLEAASNIHKITLLSAYRALMNMRHQHFLEQEKQRVSLGIVAPVDVEEYEEITEVVEEILSEKSEVVA